MYFCREVTRLKCAALLLVEKASMKVVRRFFFFKKLLYWNSTLYVFLNLQRDQNFAHFLYLFGDFLIFDVSTFEYISLLSRIQCFMKKYWFWGKNMFHVHIILKLCFILSLNGRPMQMDNKYLETWPWFKCASLNCTIQFSMH